MVTFNQDSQLLSFSKGVKVKMKNISKEVTRCTLRHADIKAEDWINIPLSTDVQAQLIVYAKFRGGIK